MNPDGNLGEDYQQVITNHDAKPLHRSLVAVVMNHML
jgi:hypothetical protein